MSRIFWCRWVNRLPDTATREKVAGNYDRIFGFVSGIGLLALAVTNKCLYLDGGIYPVSGHVLATLIFPSLVMESLF